MTGSGGVEIQVFPSPCAFRQIEFAAVRSGAAAGCGNGNLDPGESCDDGNQLFGDCCTPVCTFNAPGWPCSSDGQACTLDRCDGAGTCTHALQPAGTLCRGPAGLCDVAETCDGTSPACPPDQLLPAGAECRPSSGPCDAAETCTGGVDCPADNAPPDTDQDGVADACDVCPNGIHADEPRLRLGKYDGTAGNDTLVAQGEFVLSSAAAAFLNPVTQGFRVVVGHEIGLPGQLDVLAPPGAYDPVVKQGWKVSRSGLTSAAATRPWRSPR
jgi:cysteine-rich repeat protein